MALGEGVKLTWFGHATWLLESQRGRRILVDPWFEDNPACPAEMRDPGPIDLLLLTHGHSDHAADALRVGASGVPTIAIFELASILLARGVPDARGMNKGGTQMVDGIAVTMVNGFHSSAFTDGDQTLYAGEAAGYVVRLEDGYTVYFAGDTCLFGDMALIGRMHRLDVAVLPIGDHFTMGPREAAEAIRLLASPPPERRAVRARLSRLGHETPSDVPKIVVGHYGTFPALTGTPEALREEAADIEDLEIIAVAPGGTIE